MTRKSLSSTLRSLYVALTVTLLITLVAKFADHIPGLKQTAASAILKDLYEFVRDMALLIATAGVAYVTNVFQRRHTFIESLREEWREIIETKSELLKFMHKPTPTHEEYVAAFTRLSEAIDNMRIVYRNVGETPRDIGLYPFAPLHDMRRVLQTLDPRITPAATPEQRKLARDTMLQSFYALRECFLEELDLEEPDNPLLISGARRLKRSGSTAGALAQQGAQRSRQDQAILTPNESDALLARLYAEEQARNGG